MQYHGRKRVVSRESVSDRTVTDGLAVIYS